MRTQYDSSPDVTKEGYMESGWSVAAPLRAYGGEHGRVPLARVSADIRSLQTMFFSPLGCRDDSRSGSAAHSRQNLPEH